MLINGVAFPAHYWPHAEWPQTPPQKLLYGWRHHQRECRGAWRCALRIPVLTEIRVDPFAPLAIAVFCYCI